MRINKTKAIKIINEVKTIVLDWKKYVSSVLIKDEIVDSIDNHIQRVISQLDE